MTLNIAHRGFSGLYPENTMLAFKKAKEEGFCDGIELDVQLTKDLIPVIIHDEELERITDVKGLVKDFTYKEIRTFNAGENEKIPSLEEYLEFAKENNIYTNIELKNSILEYPSLEKKTLNLIDKFNFKDSIIVSSFNYKSIAKIKTLDKTIKTGLLYKSHFINLQKYFDMCGADAIHSHYTAFLRSKDLLKNLLENNIEVSSYTIDEEIYMKKFIKEGISSIITNHPDKLHQILIDEKRI